MTSRIQEMTRDGLIEPRRDPTDGRATVVRLSPRGRAFRPVTERVLAALDARLERAIPTTDLETIRATLKEARSDAEMALLPTRVIDMPSGTSAFTFTMFQAPGMPDDLFESQHRSLIRELAHIRARSHSGRHLH